MKKKKLKSRNSNENHFLENFRLDQTNLSFFDLPFLIYSTSLCLQIWLQIGGCLASDAFIRYCVIPQISNLVRVSTLMNHSYDLCQKCSISFESFNLRKKKDGFEFLFWKWAHHDYIEKHQHHIQIQLEKTRLLSLIWAL